MDEIIECYVIEELNLSNGEKKYKSISLWLDDWNDASADHYHTLEMAQKRYSQLMSGVTKNCGYSYSIVKVIREYRLERVQN